MSLNSTETEQLRAVRSIIETVLRDGFDPTSNSSYNLQVGRALKKASSVVHAITQLKGFYPK